MNYSNLLLFLVSFLFLTACGSNGTSTEELSKNEQLREEIIEAHDEVMPKMGELKSLEKKAIEAAEELQAADPVDTNQVEALKALAYDLNEAHEAMFVWMRQYEVEDGERSEEELKSYLDDQLEKVNEVNVKVKDALKKAGELLD